jgi:acetoin utilization deacetylase AcuC-like enzyme
MVMERPANECARLHQTHSAAAPSPLAGGRRPPRQTTLIHLRNLCNLRIKLRVGHLWIHSTSKPVHAYYSDHFVLPLPEGHRFPMAKYSRLRERLVAEGIISSSELLQAPAASWDDLRLVHTGPYLNDIASGTLPREAQRRIGFPWSEAMVERARRSVGATIAAAQTALDEGVSANLAGGTHHAFPDRGEGYCVFNDVAVAAHVLQREQRARRVAVIDLDVHQGNGTAAIFRDDRSVFTCSIHGAQNFPFKKEVSDFDVALPDGTGDQEYLAALDKALTETLNHHQPDFVFYLAGADPYEGDRLGRMKLTIDGLRERDEMVFERCRRMSLPMAVSMSGGYAPDIDAIVTIHTNTIRIASRFVAPLAPLAP